MPTIEENIKKNLQEIINLLGEGSIQIDNNSPLPLQRIYYGSPGTGKSHEIETKILNGVPDDRIFRTTFHPDSDYASFVGAYKPVMDGDKIRYEFEPQAFTDAYVTAWKNPSDKVFLIIEEINRGNCAQVFGDLFQLLDRKDGKSEYPIKADKSLCKYLENQLDKDTAGIKDGKLCLPPNLHILATMNTSDQSLFPMDSAFKRRWDWKYVPINYSNEVESAKYKINIDYKGKTFTFSWIDFLKEVNERIKSTTDSEDKQMGNFFIKHSIDADEFKGKVMFYLWSEICKEEYHNQERNFMQRVSVTKGDEDITEEIEKRIKICKKESDDKKKEKFFITNLSEFGPEEFSFNELYDDREKGNGILLGFMYGLGLLPETPKDDNGQQGNPDGQTPAASTGAEGPAEGDSESQE